MLQMLEALQEAQAFEEIAKSISLCVSATVAFTAVRADGAFWRTTRYTEQVATIASNERPKVFLSQR